MNNNLRSTVLRDQNLSSLRESTFDVAIVGGGINGAASAAALAFSGYKVALLEQNDFASATSQASSNFVWGGIKYLQTFEFGLVRKLCRSRNQLMKAYPTQIRETDFVATIGKKAPAITWLFPFGTLLYWGLGKFRTNKPRPFTPEQLKKLEPSIATSRARLAARYSDGCLLDHDARFVWNLIARSIDFGAIACNYISANSFTKDKDGNWDIKVTDNVSDDSFTLRAKAVVNATGPNIDTTNETADVTTDHAIVLSKGIHLVIDKAITSDRVLGFYDDDGRLFYIIPMAHRSVIGTTDTPTKDPQEGVTEEDREFLLKQVNDRLDLDEPLTQANIIAERCGVRPLVTEAATTDANESWFKLSRKHVLEVDDQNRYLSIFGGKLTDSINIGNEVLAAVSALEIGHEKPSQNRSPQWFGEPSAADKDAFIAEASALGLGVSPEIERLETLAEVLWMRYGSKANKVLAIIAEDSETAKPILPESDISFAELQVMARDEMIVSAEDFLRRRTKLSLVHRSENITNHPNYEKILQTLGLF